MKMEFEWDDGKEESNRAKHGVLFEYGARVFLDPARIDFEDVRRDYSEERRIVLGEIDRELFVVIYTPRQEVKRLISARKANDRERRKYAGTLHP
jgi:uncharacterized protein